MTLSPRQLAAASGGQEAHPATPYQQVVHPPRQVRLPLPSPRLKLQLARVRVWLRGEDHKPGSKEVAGNRPLIPEQGRTGPPPEDLRGEGALQARILWRTSWTLCPRGGRGISCT